MIAKATCVEKFLEEVGVVGRIVLQITKNYKWSLFQYVIKILVLDETYLLEKTTSYRYA